MADPLARLAPSLRAACLRAAADAHARFAATQTQKQPAAHVLASSTIPLVEPLAIDVPWEGLRRSEGVDPQPMRSGRLVADQLLSAAEAARLATMVRALSRVYLFLTHFFLKAVCKNGRIKFQ